MDTITQVELQIPETSHQRAWQHSQSYSTPKAQWDAYLNQVCLDTVLPWLQTEYAPEAIALPHAWELVNGSVIQLGEKRLILVPDKSADTSELRVPQEWMDIPSWVGDYYLAVQVDPDELSLRVWAYTTHEQIKTIGQYEPSDRSYSIDAQYLVEDISVLWVVRQLYPDEPTRAVVPSLVGVPELQAENLLQRLVSVDRPRLEIPFQLWGALLENPSWRRRFCQLRQGESVGTSAVTNLSQWLTNTFSESWQALENWLNPDELAFSLRRSETAETTIRRVKPLQFPDQTILMIIALTPEPNDRVSVRVQLRTEQRGECLPLDLQLSLISAAGETIQSVQAREQDNSIQLQRFKCRVGTPFSVQVAIADTTLTESFES